MTVLDANRPAAAANDGQPFSYGPCTDTGILWLSDGASWYPLLNPGVYRGGQRAGLREAGDRYMLSGNQGITSGTNYGMLVQLAAGDTVGHLGVSIGTTAAATPSHAWLFLLDAATFSVQAVTADNGAGAIPANSPFELATTAVFTAPASGLYVVGFCFQAATAPSIRGASGTGMFGTPSPAHPQTTFTGGSGGSTPPALASQPMGATPGAWANAAYCWARP